ncbi:MAG: hypothetical protein KDA64_05420 [Rhodospirillaceae bacterium]|nr:hypothetical protein [Rhodospirillaceae bacterium]
MIARLALADLAHERTMTACLALGLAAILAPLLVLFALRTGVVDGLSGQLTGDPAAREVRIIGNRSYDAAFLQDLAQQPEVGFVVARTRSIATSITLLPQPGAATGAVEAELVPSGPGDPVLGDLAGQVTGEAVVLSHRLALDMALAAGDTAALAVIRQAADGRRSRVDLPVTVAGVLPASAGDRNFVYADLAVLEAVEAYRDGNAVPHYGWEGEPPAEGPRSYASFRLYAATIGDVEALADRMTELGIGVRTELDRIRMVDGLDRNLTRIFTILAGLGGIGYVLSLGASLWANVDRKRVALSTLALMGVPPGRLVGFPVVQAVAIAGLGFALAVAAFALAQAAINATFAAPGLAGQPVSVLHGSQIALAGLATGVAALAPSLIAGWRAARVEPAEGIRDV